MFLTLQTSIKNKILIPFMVVILLLTTCFLIFFTWIFNSHLQNQLVDEKVNLNKLLIRDIEKSFKLIELHLDVIKSPTQANTVVFDALYKNQNINFYNLNLSERSIPEVLTSIVSKLEKKPKVVDFVYNKDNNFFLIGGGKRNGQMATIMTQAISFDKIQDNLEHSYIGFSVISGDSVQLFTPSPFISDNKYITSIIKKEVKLLKNLGLALSTSKFEFNNKHYQLLVQNEAEYPNLYIANIISLDQNLPVIIKYISGSILIALILCFLIFVIYTFVIKKITSSIDILTSVSKKVSEGDLEQFVYVSTEDEIGQLSQMFNQMVTSLKKSSEDLIKEKNQSQTIVSNVPAGIVVSDFDHNIILVNKMGEKMLGLENTDYINKSIHKVINEKEIISVFKKRIATIDNSIITREVTFSLSKEHKQKTFSMISCLDLGADQSVNRVITVFRDISREQEIKQLRESFLRTVSHELRTPLTSIIGFIEFVKSTKSLEESNKQYLQIAYDEALDLKKLIDDLLELSRIEAKKLDLEIKTVNVYELLEQLIKSLKPLAKGKDLKIVNLLIDKSLTIKADPQILKRILVNLMTNAIKFTQTGVVSLDCQKVLDKELEFSVKDTGIGLLDEEKILFLNGLGRLIIVPRDAMKELD